MFVFLDALNELDQLVSGLLVPICYLKFCTRVFNSSGGWDASWEKGVTPWDLGQPTPVILHLHQTGALPKGRALIPGCGSVCKNAEERNISRSKYNCLF